jgi:hypothetical protein
VRSTFGAKITKATHACSSRATVVALSLSPPDTARIPDALPAVEMRTC